MTLQFLQHGPSRIVGCSVRKVVLSVLVSAWFSRQFFYKDFGRKHLVIFYRLRPRSSATTSVARCDCIQFHYLSVLGNCKQIASSECGH